MKRFWSKPKGCRLFHLFTGRMMSKCSRWDRYTVVDEKKQTVSPNPEEACASCWRKR